MSCAVLGLSKIIRRLCSKTYRTSIKELSDLAPGGCRFELTNEVERFRVLEYGAEREFLERILRLLSPGDVLYDIGACVGMLSLHAAAMGVHVIAFEPDPHYRTRLNINMRLNDSKGQIRVVEWAVSDENGSADLYVDVNRGWSASLRQSGDREPVEVKTIRIDTAIAAGDLPTPTAVKMDIEGAEGLALQGMQETLRSERAPRLIALETHPKMLPAFGSTEADVTKLVESAGYVRQYYQRRFDQAHHIYLLDRVR